MLGKLLQLRPFVLLSLQRPLVGRAGDAMKLSQLDADSKIGHGPTSGTGQHRIQSMVPPRDHPIAVWEALAKLGKLRREGDGFYSIVEQPGGAHW
jgi:hypothetical protein